MKIVIMYISKCCSRLLSSQKINFVISLNGFGTQELFKYHDKGCMEVEGQQIEMPTQDEKLKIST